MRLIYYFKKSFVQFVFVYGPTLKEVIMMTQTDTIGWNLKNSYQSLPDLFYSSVEPTPTKHPEIIVLNEELADSLGLSRDELQNEQGKDIVAGDAIPGGGKPIAQRY